MQEKNTEKNTTCNHADILWDSPDLFNSAEKKVIAQFIKKAVEEPPYWWKNLTPFIEEKKTVSEVIENISQKDFEGLSCGLTQATSKRCPGIINHLSHSVLIKAPCDILIDVRGDNIQWVTASKYVSVSMHDFRQTGEFNYHILKFNLPIHYTTNVPCQVSVVDPVFYNDNGYRLSPGLLEDSTVCTTDINIIAIFPKTEKKYYIKNGSVLALLQFDKKIKNIVNEDLSEMYALTQHNLNKNLFTNSFN